MSLVNRSLQQLKKFTVCGAGAEIGRIEGFLADLDRWAVRYIAVARPEPSRRLHLLSPLSLAAVDWQQRRIRARMSRLEMEAGPSVAAGQQVSRAQEAEHNRHFRLPAYWGGVGLWGDQLLPVLLARSREPARDEAAGEKAFHLISSGALLDRRVHSPAGPLGRVADLLMDQDSWAIRFLVVDGEGEGRPGPLMVDPAWVELRRPDGSAPSGPGALFVGLPPAAIREATEIRETKPWKH